MDADCTGCGAPATDEVCDVNAMPAGVRVWHPVCDSYPDCKKRPGEAADGVKGPRGS